MKSVAAFKVIPLLAIALYTMSRHIPGTRGKPDAEPARTTKIDHVGGLVQRVLKDERYTYALVQDGKDSHWVAFSEGAPVVGQQVDCHVAKTLEAYESRKLAMAFDRVLIAES